VKPFKADWGFESKILILLMWLLQLLHQRNNVSGEKGSGYKILVDPLNTPKDLYHEGCMQLFHTPLRE